MTIGIERSLHCICHDDHAILIRREPSRDEERSHVLHIGLTSFQLVFGPCIVDADEEGLSATHDECWVSDLIYEKD